MLPPELRGGNDWISVGESEKAPVADDEVVGLGGKQSAEDRNIAGIAGKFWGQGLRFYELSNAHGD